MYSLNEYFFRGHPMVEVLVDDRPWGETYPWDKHFQFGYAKGRLLMSCTNIFKLFDENDGTKPTYEHTSRIYNHRDGSLCQVTNHPSFVRNGRRINKPYLEINSGINTIRLGYTKVEAILLLEDEIRDIMRIH